MADGKAQRHRKPRAPLPPRTRDAQGLDSIFWGDRLPSHDELMAYYAYSGTTFREEGGELVPNTGFMSKADAAAYYRALRAMPGIGGDTPDN